MIHICKGRDPSTWGILYIYNILPFNILHLIYPVLCYHNQATLTVHLFTSLHGDVCDFFRKIKEKQDCS